MGFFNFQISLIKFLNSSDKKGYASKNARKIKEKDKSKTIVVKNGDWEYNDNYFGAFGLVFGQNLAWLGFWQKNLTGHLFNI